MKKMEHYLTKMTTEILMSEDIEIEKHKFYRYKKEHDSKPVYNKKLQKTKIKSNSDEATDFHNKEIPKVDSSHTCLEKTLEKDENYYLQVFLKKQKYNGKEKKQ